jgi:endonuclease-8
VVTVSAASAAGWQAAGVPEGHTIHRLATDQARDLAGGAVAATSPQGRFREGAAQIDGSVLRRTEAWGKHLFHHYDGGILHVHLGLIGGFRRMPLDSCHPGVVRLRLEGPTTAWELTGPQTCRVVTEVERWMVIDRLGPDPLRRGASGEDFVARLRRRRAPVGAVLLDQEVIAGLGNVYRSELLFLAGQHPLTPAADLPVETATELWRLAREQLRLGYRLNRIVTIAAEDRPGVSPGRVAQGERFYVYGREGLPCRRCGTPISATRCGGRTAWWCMRCQST